MTKTACIVQGNIREGTARILLELSKKFTHVLFVTWQGEPISSLEDLKIEILQMEKPSNFGLHNRNLQRASTSAGIKHLKGKGFAYLMKWRSDMIILDFNPNEYIELINQKSSKLNGIVIFPILTSDFRFINLAPDIFSTIPDYYCFGRFEDIETIWSDDGFDFTKNINIPPSFKEEIFSENVAINYPTESEVYLWFRYRLENKLKILLSYDQIVRKCILPISHKKMNIFWFSSVKGKFRSIPQALEHPWYKVKKGVFQEPTVLRKGYPVETLLQKIRLFLSPLYLRIFQRKDALNFKNINNE